MCYCVPGTPTAFLFLTVNSCLSQSFCSCSSLCLELPDLDMVASFFSFRSQFKEHHLTEAFPATPSAVILPQSSHPPWTHLVKFLYDLHYYISWSYLFACSYVYCPSSSSRIESPWGPGLSYLPAKSPVQGQCRALGLCSTNLLNRASWCIVLIALIPSRDRDTHILHSHSQSQCISKGRSELL